MEVAYEGAPPSPPSHGSVVAVGTFDGVHRGHAALLAEARSVADDLGVPLVVVTFDRHPAVVVRPDSAPRLLTGLAHRLELLEGCRVDRVDVLRFDEERSLQPPEEFAREVLVERWAARSAVVGDDFHFGHRRRGTATGLTEIGAREGFTVVVVPRLVDGETGEPITSGAIRAALARSDVATANRLLGRRYEVRGPVEHGDARGREIGFPTANVAVAGDICLPADGVYAGWYVRPDGRRCATAISIGRRPTFYTDHGLLLVEAHLLDFDGDLYGEQARVEIEAWLRSQTRFGSVDDLRAQLERDVAATRALLT